MHPSAKTIIELRDSTLARRFVLEGLLLERIKPTGPRSVAMVLEWYLEAAVEGVPLPPVGVVADVGHLVFGDDPEISAGSEKPTDDVLHESPILPSTLTRQYEDHFLGKLYADRSFDRGVDGIRRYSDRRERAKALAFLIRQIGVRAGIQGVHLSPAVVRELMRWEGKDVLAKARESLSEHGPLTLEELELLAAWEELDPKAGFLEWLYQDLVRKIRAVGDVLGPEDVFELEHGTAISGEGQRVALRQVLTAAAMLEASAPHQPVRPLSRRTQVATQIVDEDTYPIGGFSSISNQGSVESLLHSQLAYMETDERPDMFDIKFLRDELLYYSRDENQFLRRRRRFAFAFFPDLTSARVKDATLPWQRIVLLMGLLVVSVRKLIDWLSEDALVFDFGFFPREKPDAKSGDLSHERELFEILFREQIANGTVRLSDFCSVADFHERCEQASRHGLCHAILLSASPQQTEIEPALTTHVQLDGPVPRITIDEEEWENQAATTPIEQWSEALNHLLAAWVAG